MGYRIVDVGKDSLPIIKPVWEELNRLHLADSVNFKEYYRNFTFERRMGAFAGTKDSDLKISVVFDGDRVTGYCLSTVEGQRGEIESLCLLEELRGQGLGRRLVDSHVEWMKSRGCAKITVSVAHGHDSALGFYVAMGFRERMIVLEYTGEREWT